MEQVELVEFFRLEIFIRKLEFPRLVLRYIKLVFLFVFLYSPCFSQDTIKINEAIDIALQNNLQIKQSNQTEISSSLRLKQSKLNLLPTFNFSGAINSNFGRSIDPYSYNFVTQQVIGSTEGITSSMQVFQGGVRLSQISQNKVLLEADKSYTKKLKNDLILNVLSTYILCLSNRSILKAAEDQLRIQQQQINFINKEFLIGSKTKADVAQVKAEYANAQLNISNAENQLELSLLNLAQLMERDPRSKFELQSLDINPINEELLSLSWEAFIPSFETFPEIQMAEFKTKAAFIGVKISRQSLLPRLSFQGSISSGYSSLSQRSLFTSSGTSYTDYAPIGYQFKKNFNQGVGFALTIPLFNASQLRFSLQQARLTYQTVKIDEEITKDLLKKTIFQALVDLKAAKSKYISLQSVYNASVEAFEAIRKRYQVGLVNILNFDQSQTEMNNAQFNLIESRYNYIFRRKVIDFYLGKDIQF